MPRNSAQYMKEYRANNADYAKANRRRNKARNRALNRLAERHSREFGVLLGEAMTEIIREEEVD